MADPGSALTIGAVIEVEVGAVAAGGLCIARHDGRVVFVRHALPGERVRARITEDRGGSYCRADAVDVLEPSPQRVEPPCPYAGAGRCGGCDWQHASGDAQREMKDAIIREQFTRIARLSLDGIFDGVTELPGGLLGWRTRITFAVDRDGRPGLHRYRDREIERVDRCLLGVDGVGDSSVLARRWPTLTGVEVVVGEGSEPGPAVLEHRPGRGRHGRGRRPPDRVRVIDGPARLEHRIGDRPYSVAAGGFWQVHPHAAAALADAVINATAPRPGDRVLELYAGAGALTALLAEAVGPTGRVYAVEASATAVEDARRNLDELPWAEVRRGRVDAALVEALGTGADRETGIDPDIVVLDPPRAGAGTATITALLALRPRCIGYVSCDPASLARDVRAALDSGWVLRTLQAFDAFPMTAHVECFALLVPPPTAHSPR